MYKAIFIDIDGTLRNSNKKITKNTINAIKKYGAKRNFSSFMFRKT